MHKNKKKVNSKVAQSVLLLTVLALPDGVDAGRLFCGGFETCLSLEVSQSHEFVQTTEFFPLSSEFDIAIRQSGFPAIAYVSDGLFFFDCANEVCSSGTSRQLAESAVGIEIAIGNDGNPVISYHDAGDAHLYTCTTDDCSSGVDRLLASATGNNTSVAVGLDGKPIVTFRAASGGIHDHHLGIYACDDASCSSGALHTPEVCESFLQYDALHTTTQVAILPDGNPIIAMRCEEAECESPKCSDLTMNTWSVSLYTCSSPDCSTGAGGSNPGIYTVGLQNLRDLIVKPDGDWLLLQDGEPLYDPSILLICDSNGAGGCAQLTVEVIQEDVIGSRLALPDDMNPIIAYGPPFTLFRCTDPMCSDGYSTTLSSTYSFAGGMALNGNDDPALVYTNSSTGPVGVFSCLGELCSVR